MLTFLSDRNCPEITWRSRRVRRLPRVPPPGHPGLRPPWLHLDPQGIGHDAIHDVLGEGVKRLVWPPHELRLEQVATAPVVLEHACVELHRHIWGPHGEEGQEGQGRAKGDQGSLGQNNWGQGPQLGKIRQEEGPRVCQGQELGLAKVSVWFGKLG